MKVSRPRALAFGALLPALMWIGSPPAYGEPVQRIRFHVLTVEEKPFSRSVLSEATIEGPPGTDFEIELRGGRFKMTARFLTDFAVSGALDVKARLDTRRLYGYSERDLPLYEEDSQTHELSLDLQDKIILLPFGSPTSDQRLAIEITPTLRPETDRQDLDIDILKRSEDGAVQIRAFLLPHRFVLNAVLLRDGVELARGSGRCVLEGTGSVRLQAIDRTGRGSPGKPIDVSVKVNDVFRERPTDLVAFDYEVGAQRGSGVVPLNVPLEFDVSGPDDPGRRNHVLRLTIFAGEPD